MYYSLRGKLIHIESGIAVIECGGVGYRCQTTLNTQRDIKLDAENTLYTYMNVREDAIELYGFSTLTELSTFKMLISVNGVGPKAGISILSILSPEQVAIAVASSDAKMISKANGVGNKIAQRIILELKDKIAKISDSDNPTNNHSQQIVVNAGNYSKAIEALMVLGYSSADVSSILYTLDSSMPVEKLIGETLKKMGNKI